MWQEFDVYSFVEGEPNVLRAPGFPEIILKPAGEPLACFMATVLNDVKAACLHSCESCDLPC